MEQDKPQVPQETSSTQESVQQYKPGECVKIDGKRFSLKHLSKYQQQPSLAGTPIKRLLGSVPSQDVKDVTEKKM